MEINKDVQKSVVDYSMDTIKHICTNLPPRESGSAGERMAQEHLAKDINDNKWADKTIFEEFKVAPRAFMGFSKIIPLLLLIGIFFFVLRVTWAPLAMCSLSLIIFIAQFGLYKQFLDPLYKASTSSNLLVIKNSTSQAKKRIIFSGHSDAAYEWTMFQHFGKVVFIGGIILALVGVIVTLIISIISLSTSFRWWQFFTMLAFIPGYVALFFFSNYQRVVPGANDNLTGSLAAVSVLKYMKEANLKFEDTEVMALITGSEEAGLRGAKAFAKAHKNDFKDIPTMFIGLETFRDIGHMANYVRDLSGTVKHHPEAIELIDKAAIATFGKTLPHTSVYLGASDAAAITQAGIRAGAIASMDPAPANYYHTRKDNCENLCPECYENGFALVLNVLDIYAKEY